MVPPRGSPAADGRWKVKTVGAGAKRWDLESASMGHGAETPQHRAERRSSGPVSARCLTALGPEDRSKVQQTSYLLHDLHLKEGGEEVHMPKYT